GSAALPGCADQAGSLRVARAARKRGGSGTRCHTACAGAVETLSRRPGGRSPAGLAGRERPRETSSGGRISRPSCRRVNRSVAPGAQRWTFATALVRAVQVAREEGVRSLWFKALGETIYRRLAIVVLDL